MCTSNEIMNDDSDKSADQIKDRKSVILLNEDKSKASDEKNKMGGNRTKIMSKEELMYSLMTPETSAKSSSLLDVTLIDAAHRKVAIGVFTVWSIMTASAMLLIPPSQKRFIPETSQNAEKLVAIIMMFTLLSRIIPNFALGPISTKKEKYYSGVLITALVVQFCAAISNGMMGWFPSPIYVDPYTKCDVNILRWCEWVPLSFAMAFITDGIDADRMSTPLTLGTTQALSTLGGLLLPFMSSPTAWIIVLIISCLLFFYVYVRLYVKINRFRGFPRGVTVDEIENYDRVMIATRLAVIGSATWSLLVLTYFFRWYSRYVYNIQEFELIDIFESAADVVAKYFYLNIVLDAHRKIFDNALRIERKLDELRRTMAVIWNSSKDVLIISVKFDDNKTKTQMSPAIFKLLTSSDDDAKQNYDDMMVYEENAFTFEQDLRDYGFNLALQKKTSPPTQDSPRVSSESNSTQDLKLLIARAWGSKKNFDANSDKNNTKSELFISQEIHNLDDPNSFIHCESNITYLNESFLVMVLRDVTERYKRFEAEKKIVTQLTSRKKDNEANRFTRHEVKNGLLAAIGLCDNFREELSTSPLASLDGSTHHDSDNSMKTEERKSKADIFDSSQAKIIEECRLVFHERILEIDTTLNQTLDIVTTHTMSRDLVNGEYIPRIEFLDLPLLFSSTKASETRFPVSTIPNPFPSVALDPKLLQYVHRNAVTNSMKYGEKGGLIETVFILDEEKNLLEMQVVNQAGPGHSDILKLGKKANDIIFSPGKSLHNQLSSNFEKDEKAQSSSVSAGDGAWIMKNCALCMGGNCDVSFESDKTIFSLVVPVKLGTTHLLPGLPFMGSGNNPGAPDSLEESENLVNVNDYRKELFPLPGNTLGIAIDDSRVQRKLLSKCLRIFGISDDNIIIKGSTYNEVRDFADLVVDIVEENPSDYVLIIADENMDLTDETTGIHTVFSGSSLIQDFLTRLGNEGKDSNVLALVRSANDSSSDIALYKSRSHGFLPKVPLNKEKLELMLTPLWINRFKTPRKKENDKKQTNEHTIKSNAYDLHFPKTRSVANFENSADALSVEADFISVINQIDTLMMHNEDTKNWNLAKELLHVLKGDIMTQTTSCLSIEAMEIISEMRTENYGNEKAKQLWMKLNPLVIELLHKATLT